MICVQWACGKKPIGEQQREKTDLEKTKIWEKTNENLFYGESSEYTFVPIGDVSNIWLYKWKEITNSLH